MRELMIASIYDDAANMQTWADWRDNYISYQSLVTDGKAEALDLSGDVFYFLHPDSMVLGPPARMVDVPLVEHPRHPFDMHRVTFTGLLQRLGPEDFPSLDYSTTGYEVPPVEVLDAPLTLPMLRRYRQYYTDGGGKQEIEYAEFGPYQLHGKRWTVNRREQTWWSIIRRPGGSDEVLMNDGSWKSFRDADWYNYEAYGNFLRSMPKALDELERLLK